MVVYEALVWSNLSAWVITQCLLGCLTHCFQLKASDPCRVGEGSASTVAERKEARHEKQLRPNSSEQSSDLWEQGGRRLRVLSIAAWGCFSCEGHLSGLDLVPSWAEPVILQVWTTLIREITVEHVGKWSRWHNDYCLKLRRMWSWDSGSEVREREVAWKEKVLLWERRRWSRAWRLPRWTPSSSGWGSGRWRSSSHPGWKQDGPPGNPRTQVSADNRILPFTCLWQAITAVKFQTKTVGEVFRSSDHAGLQSHLQNTSC